MDAYLSNIKLEINRSIFLKDPDSSELGKKIITGSISLIAEIGFERFTFKKLALQIQSTEASIYRYFESKHNLLVYLVVWYWRWMEYRLVFGTNNIEDNVVKLKKAIRILTEDIQEDSNFTHINEKLLNQIVIQNASKIYFIKEVEKENKEGFYLPFKELVERVSQLILNCNKNFMYPHMLVTSMIEGARHQRFFAANLPKLTDIVPGEDAIVEFYSNMVLKTIID